MHSGSCHSTETLGASNTGASSDMEVYSVPARSPVMNEILDIVKGDPAQEAFAIGISRVWNDLRSLTSRQG